MKKLKTILEDSNPNKNWRVIAQFDSKIWLEESTSINEENFKLANYNVLDTNNVCYDTSTLYEVNLDSGEKNEIELYPNPYILMDLKPTKNYLYASIIFDSNNDGKIAKDDQEKGKVLLKFNRNSKEIETIYSFEKEDCYQCVNIEQVLEELAILLRITVLINNDIVERYDLFRLDNNQMENIYVDNEDMMDCQVLLTKVETEPIAILDLHVTPSDKRISGGLSDKILILKFT